MCFWDWLVRFHLRIPDKIYYVNEYELLCYFWITYHGEAVTDSTMRYLFQLQSYVPYPRKKMDRVHFFPFFLS